ncbi:hypothetical protein [Trinickia terrae]|uniref:hypothetical protein n=1 Tax=Trinickia terrae TaxID=2571161 RepID=UPI001F0F7C64|nr:hypothetical protein [Trinickia terrae]
MQVSARVTVTPFNLDLPSTLDTFIGMGFHSVGFSPLLRASNGRAEMGPGDMADMLQGMIACGLAFEQKVMRGERYPFSNMQNALREIQRGTHRPYPCGAGAGYFGVSADGELAACHHEVLARGRSACDYIRGWLHYVIGAHGRLARYAPAWFAGPPDTPSNGTGVA